MTLQSVTFTGADDNTIISELGDASKKFPHVEWGILYHLEKEGTPRNPSRLWRDNFLKYSEGRLNIAAHLCGKQVFQELLNENTRENIIEDLKRYSRVQLNINARSKDFTDEEVLDIIRIVYVEKINIILQYNDDSKDVIDVFLNEAKWVTLENVHILFDSSKGKGICPETRPDPLRIYLNTESGTFTFFFYHGYAGGLNNSNITEQLSLIDKIPRANIKGIEDEYWIDMETGVRTNNEFDLNLVRSVLLKTLPFLK